MTRVRGFVFRDLDDALDYFTQREIDDDAERKMDAFIKGRQAGLLQIPAGANEYPMGTPEAAEWERGRSSVEAQRAAEALRQRARRNCDPCTCGGRGLCLADAA